MPVNRRIVLARRPHGAPTANDFRIEDRPLPELADGQVLLRTVYLSLDPYMRGRMSDAPSYAKPVEVGDPMVGATVSRVEASRSDRVAPGDLVVGYGGWQSYVVASGRELARLDPRIPKPSYALGVLGMPGYTAYHGLLAIGDPKPGETVVVAAATGAVGAVVGQIAKIKGARAVGIAGGADKCAYAVDALGFDACLDHRGPALADELKAACPKGIDVYFENVGGRVFDAVLPLMNPFGRIPVCGLVALYNATAPDAGPDRTALLMSRVLRSRLRVEGFIISDHNAGLPAFFDAMTAWVADGRVKTREDIVAGLDAAPAAFIGLLEGKNFGKLVVQVSDL